MKLKKWILIAGVAVLGVGLVGTGAVKKYASYAQQKVKTWVDDNADPKEEIERLKAQLKDLDKTEGDIKNALAKDINQSNKLTKQVEDLRAAIAKEDEAVRSFAKAIQDTQGNKVSLGKLVMSVDDAKRKLAADFEAITARNASLKTMEAAQGQREEAKRLLAGQLAEIEIVRSELANDLQMIELEYKSLELQAMKNKNYKDDGKIGELREGIEKLKDKVNEKRIRVGLDTGKGKVEGASKKSVQEMLDEYNSKNNPKSGD